jgi:prevent-host-death family protein
MERKKKLPSKVNIHDAKTHFSKLVDRVANGEEIIIAKAGHPVVKLVPLETPKKGKRPLGLYKGQIWISPDFDDPDPELEKLFYGENDDEDPLV